MARFTGWLALIVLLGGLGYVMYEDLKLRRESAAESTVASGEAPTGPTAANAPEQVASAEAPVDELTSSRSLSIQPRPPAAVHAADEPASTGPADVAATSGDSAVAASDTDSPAAPADESTPQDASNAAAVPATPPVASAAEPEATPAAEPAPVASAEVPPAGDTPATPGATASEPVEPVAMAEAPPVAPLDDAPDAAKVPEPVTETRSSAGGEDDAPVTAPEPDAAADQPVVEEKAIAVAPEGTPGMPEGDKAPVSESSDLDHTLQTAAEPAPEPETATDTETETVVAAVDPGANVDAPPPAGDPAPLQPGTETETAGTVPTFDVVRVEPTGDAVMAGVAAPGAEIEILSGATTVATATASATGDWAIALEEPLAAGPHDLAIRATTEDGTTAVSEQRVAIVVPEAAVEEPLVVLNTPDGPSTVLQVPDAGAMASGADVPVEPETPATAPAVITEAGAAAADGASPVPPVADAGAAAPAAIETADSAEAEPPAMTAGSAPGAPSGETEVAVNAPPASAAAEAGADAGGNGVASAPVTDAETPGSTADAPAPAGPDVAVVSAPEPAPEPEPEPIKPVVVVTAVEAETSGALFVAGTAVTPEVVRVYLDDLLLGEATPSPSGTWLLEIAREMPAGTYDVRADQIEAGSGTVIARAEVPFEREIDVAILTPVAEAGGPAGAEATGNLAGPTTVIIKRSDNLWRISRQLYGKGIRWSTIYQANKDQIRNPRWIYPGQVFVLPEGNVEWVDEEARVSAE